MTCTGTTFTFSLFLVSFFLIYYGFWEITQRVVFVGRRFGTPCRFHLLGRSDQRDSLSYLRTAP